MKRSRKLISVFLTLAMLATLLLPMTAVAGGTGGTVNALTTPTTKADVPAPGKTLGTILVQTVAGAVYEGQVLTVKLPDGLEFPNPLPGGMVTAPAGYGGEINGFEFCTFVLTRMTDDEMKIQVQTVAGGANAAQTARMAANAGSMLIALPDIVLEDAPVGDIKVTLTSPSSQGFPSGEVVVGKVVGDGITLVSVDSVKTFTDTSANITMRFKEAVAGSLNSNATATAKEMKLRLPNGFEWANVAGYAAGDVVIWGSDAYQGLVTYTDNDRDLLVTFPAGVQSPGQYFSVPVRVTVADESVAKFGEVKVTISGDCDTNPTEVVIANYNEMGTTVTAENATTVVAGKVGQEIGDIVITENAPGTLTNTRTITLKLPANAKWSKLPSLDEDECGVNQAAASFVGSDGRTLKYAVDAVSAGSAGTIRFEDAEILLSGDASGKIEVEIAGTADVDGKVEVAEVQAPVTAAAGTAPEVKIGLNDQAAAELTITELAAENIAQNDLTVTLPGGVEWADVPTIEITEGDLSLDEATTNGNVLTIPVKADSAKISTIKLSNIKLDIDRTVAEGDIYAKVGGIAVNEVNDVTVGGALDDAFTYDFATEYWEITAGDKAFRDNGMEGAFPNVGTVAKAVVAKLVTPAPIDTKKSAKFVINDTKFTVNGVEYTMDVAPYIKDGRTYLPVRFVAQSLGVADSNILWDDATQKVTLLKNGMVVQLTIGSNVMLVNGAAITMDVAPELTSDRTMLPFRAIAQAFGASVGWDEATQTVTMDLM